MLGLSCNMCRNHCHRSKQSKRTSLTQHKQAEKVSNISSERNACLCSKGYRDELTSTYFSPSGLIFSMYAKGSVNSSADGRKVGATGMSCSMHAICWCSVTSAENSCTLQRMNKAGLELSVTVMELIWAALSAEPLRVIMGDKRWQNIR